jgi:Protein of unknown function (DUF751)
MPVYACSKELNLQQLVIVCDCMVRVSAPLHANYVHCSSMPPADLAAGGEEDFWGNVGAYIRFFFTVLLGTANVASQPFRKVSRVNVRLPCHPAGAVCCRCRSPSACKHARTPAAACWDASGAAEMCFVDRPLQAAKRPATAIALVVGSAVLFAFMAITVKTMLGLGDSDFEYLTRGI